ncbi:MAG: type II toxin-antitoxin system PemK/MazF family toxin [Acidobacteria bacterium]|nr:type II toxin-antitoxin system PemK/MazF family toxin [Acidobacteriota bacterium]
MEIRKWHIYLADLNPRRGTEPGKIPAVIVVQTDLLNGLHPSTVVCPLTTQIELKASYMRVHLTTGETGLKAPSDIMVDQIRAIDNRRLLGQLGSIGRRNRAKLSENLRILLS